jgi:hypothetical protein
MLLGWFYMKKAIISSVDSLLKHVMAVIAGNYAVRTAETGCDDMVMLARGFNRMAASIASATLYSTCDKGQTLCIHYRVSLLSLYFWHWARMQAQRICIL